MRREPMRAFRLAGVLLASLAPADDTAVSPRPKPTDYPAHDSVKTAALAAAIVPPEQVKKLFSAETSKNYVVVEVAIYPQDRHSFDIDLDRKDRRTRRRHRSAGTGQEIVLS